MKRHLVWPAAVVAAILALSGCARASNATNPPAPTSSVVASAAPTLSPTSTSSAGVVPRASLAPSVQPGSGRILFVIEGGPSNQVVYIDDAGQHVIPTIADKTLSHATWASSSSVIFDSERNGPQHLYRMGIDGSHILELTSGTVNQLRASVSTDGSTLAYETFTEANGGQDLGIHVANIDGSHVRVITKGTRAGEMGGDSYAAISPDGQWVAFTRATGTGQPGMWLVRIDGTGLRRLTDDSFDAGIPRWSPDGKRIMFSGHYDATSFISGPLWVVDVADGKPTPLTDPTDPGWSFDGDWSPDGQQIVFAYYQSGWNHNELRLANADGSHPATLWVSPDNTTANTPDWDN